MPTITKKIENREDFNAICDEVAVHEINLASHIAERDEKVQEVLDQYDHVIEGTKGTIKTRKALAAKWAKEHRSKIIEGDSKSGQSPLAIYSFRKGNPAIKPKGKRKIGDIIKDLIATGRKSLLNEKIDLDKNACARLSDAELSAVGLRRVQTERFHIEPKKTEKEE